ncbi:MAG: DUF2752 domain-containing protein [Clostridia bacterium]|nr:DUF2752 domain-containing protein [Clostridia bacterium]
MKFKTETPTQRLKKVIHETGIVILIGLLYYLFIKIVGRGLPCIFYETTGLLCPGCGASRMCMALIRFDFKAAFHYNPALLFGLPIIIMLIANQKIRYIKTGNNKTKRWEDIIYITLGIVLTLFAVYRNIFLPPL